ncbi:C40 family peptidase [uncultured Deefgea sp.]|uniref:C40 family peptidase n=1 Tax=uncultured Deefgea sp. TaxID=1304914 RepID=UPI0025972DED|nr:C40 family peptidase [uncultured Deefgea sp.]
MIKCAITLLCGFLILTGCTSTKPAKNKPAKPIPSLANIQVEGAGREVVMYALGLLETQYQFGGTNPEAGLDCSGLVLLVYKNALGVTLPRTAAAMAAAARPVSQSEMRAGDLVFFKTTDRSFSHVGIYLGDEKFIHAPSSNGRVRIESLKNVYFAPRFEGARTLMLANQ